MRGRYTIIILITRLVKNYKPTNEIALSHTRTFKTVVDKTELEILGRGNSLYTLFITVLAICQFDVDEYHHQFQITNQQNIYIHVKY